MNITTDGHCVKPTGSKRQCQLGSVAITAFHNDLESENTVANICGLNDHLMGTLKD
jgi:hypothetical protein